MPDNSSKPLSYIDTQGMGGPSKANYDPKKDKTVHKPALVNPRRLFTETYAKELKILINEVLDEREGKTGQSYFDSDSYKHRINEPEPEYKPWSHQSPWTLDDFQE